MVHVRAIHHRNRWPPRAHVNLRSVLDRLPVASDGRGTTAAGGDRRTSLFMWAVTAIALVSGIVCWALEFGIVAMWLFVAAAVAVALVLPLPQAFVSPLYMGIFGWLVNMVPLVILAAWTAAVIRWAVSLLRARRLPRGGRWIWLPIGLVAWTGLGVAVISGADLKHFLLLFGIQVLSSATMLAVVDSMDGARYSIAAGLVGFVVLLSTAVFLQWIGVNMQALQDTSVATRAEDAYGLDAFPNNIGMIKYARAKEGGAPEFRSKLEALAQSTPAMPSFEVFRPRFQAFESDLVVRFAGSARPVDDQLRRLDVELIYDNVGLAPGKSVPRMRSFPRNALTYAGLAAALFPVAFFFAWGPGRRRTLGVAAIGAALFGAGFSLARGAWLAILIGIVYLLVDGRLTRDRKIQLLSAFAAGAVVLTAVFLIKYETDPLNARAGAEGSVTARGNVYEDTVQSAFRGTHFLLGYGTERPRSEDGSHVGGRYIPNAGTHSTYLNYLFRTGVPGALAIAAIYAVAWLHARAKARHAKETRDTEGTFASVVAAAVVIVAAHGVILSLYVEPIYTLTISLLVGIAMTGVGRTSIGLLPWRKRAPAPDR